MNAEQAISHVDPQKWAKTSAQKKLALLKLLQRRIRRFQPELFQAELKLHGDDENDRKKAHLVGYARIAPIGIASNVAICIEIYRALAQGKMPGPLGVKSVENGYFDVHAFPYTTLERLQHPGYAGFVRVKSGPRQISPLEKPAGITAIVGAGNFTSAFEMIRALFMENCAVVFKPSRINIGVDAVWEKIFEPLVRYRAVSYCDPDFGRELVKDNRLKNIYFTGGAPAAKAIMASTDIELISECGGNNPAIIVPGIRAWTSEEIAHHARAIASGSKMNGGAVCGRIQTLVTCKNWPQRREFLDALEKALKQETPGFPNWYPGVGENFEKFRQAYPQAKLIQPERGQIENSDVLLIEDAETNGHAAKNEAFCQVLCEIPIETPPEPQAFLEQAVDLCNAELYGTLGCTILVDDETLAENRMVTEQAITRLDYGGIGVNEMPFNVGAAFWLTWGGNEEGKEFASGRGNFGNPLGLEDVEKSILYSPFMSQTHVMFTNKRALKDISRHVINFAMAPNWMNFGQLAISSLITRRYPKDF